MTHIERKLSGDALMADIEAADPGNGLVLWWLGQSAFLVKSAAGSVLFDPRLAFSRVHRHADTEKAHMRQTQTVVEPSRMTSIDAVTVSNHYANHFDAETLSSVFNANPKAVLVVPEVTRKLVAEQLGCDPAWPWGLNGGESISVGDITVLAVPVAHDEINRGELGRCRSQGYVVWFGNMKVYHGGKTRRCPEIIDLLRPLAVDVALLPVKENHRKHGIVGDLSGDEAAQLAHDIAARLVVPYHCEESDFNTESLTLFEASCRRLGQANKTLQYGEQLRIEPK